MHQTTFPLANMAINTIIPVLKSIRETSNSIGHVPIKTPIFLNEIREIMMLQPASQKSERMIRNIPNLRIKIQEERTMIRLNPRQMSHHTVRK